MSKFKAGDRVVVTYVDGVDYVSIGSSGTVLKETDSCGGPYWVRFDGPTGFCSSVYGEEAQIGGWKNNHMDVLKEDQLELVSEQEFTDEPTPGVLDALFSARDALDGAIRLIRGDV